MRRIKNRLVRLTTRVQTLREMLEKLMDDDSDMHAMHLTARAYDQLERQVSFLSCLLHIRQAGAHDTHDVHRRPRSLACRPQQSRSDPMTSREGRSTLALMTQYEE